MQTFEFGQEKKVVINFEGKKYEMRLPKIGEQRSLIEQLRSAESGDIYDIYDAFFITLGLKVKASDILDADDFLSLIEFLNNPKKKAPSSTK